MTRVFELINVIVVSITHNLIIANYHRYTANSNNRENNCDEL